MLSERKGYKLIEISNETQDIQRVFEEMMAEVIRRDYSCDDIFAIRLAVEEAMVNAARHGNKKDPGKKVRVQYRCTAEQFEICVEDEGGGFHPDRVPDPRRDENLCKPTGRGLLLMREYMDTVEYNEKGNCVHMIKKRTAE